MPKCAGEVINLNIRGRRGNIVQTYRTSPFSSIKFLIAKMLSAATEYDFVPSLLTISSEDCVDFQWAGSDFNAANQAGS